MGRETENGLQVIGCGFGRTGTLSLKTALDELGFGPTYHMFENIQNKNSDFWTKVGEVKDLEIRKKMLKNFFDNSLYRSSVDFPGNVFFEELMEIYPNAKIILSVRDSPQIWAKSARETIFGYESGQRMSFMRLPGIKQLFRFVPVESYSLTTMVETLVPRMFVNTQPEFTEDALSLAYSKWQKHCESTIKRENLLIFNVKEGWKPLCDFLDVKVPTSEFPRVNDRKTFNGWFIISQEMKGVLAFLGFYLTVGYIFYLTFFQ